MQHIGFAARVVAAELNLRRLTFEVARVTRQVNALEQVVIPRLAAGQRYIAATLEQRALEDRVRISRRAQQENAMRLRRQLRRARWNRRRVPRRSSGSPKPRETVTTWLRSSRSRSS